MRPHRTDVLYFAGYAEWRPECSCGWTGSYWIGRTLALSEADAHRHEATAQDELLSSR